MPGILRLRFAVLAVCMVGLGGSLASARLEAAAPRPAAAVRIGEHEPNLRGVRLWYRAAGKWDGRSAPVVYLSGGPGGNSYSFAHIAGPYFERKRLMIYFDQRGTGRSERPASGDYAIATLVDDIEALRVHLGVPRISLIAHSFGAILALEYAAKYPDRVERAVLAGALWDAPMSCREQSERIARLHPEAYRTMIADGLPSDDRICDAVFRAFRGEARERFNESNMFPIPATLERFNASEAASGLRNTGELSRALFAGGLLQYRFRGSDRIRAPVLVVSGTRDYAAGPKTERALAASLKRGRLLEYEGLGHWMFIDDPERFARDSIRFLRGK